MKAGFAFALLVALIAIGIFVALRATAPGPASEGDFDTPMPAMVPGAADGEELLVPAKDEAPDHPRAVVDDPKAPAPAAEEAREAPGGLRAQVVDAEGRPRGGVPVGLFDIRPERPIPRPFVQAESAQGTGIATLILPRVADVPPPPELRYAVGIYLPLDPPVLHDIGADFPTPDQEVLSLVLPAEGEAWLAPLRVQVVDPHGEPVIGARVEYRAVPRLSPEDANRLEHRYTRAPDAIVSFPREKQRESVLYAEVLRRAVDYEMVVTGPFLSPPRTTVPSPPTTELVRVVLPPTGAVEVRMVHVDGTPVVGDANAVVEWFAPGEEKRAGYVRVPVENGIARFPHVGLGLSLRVGGGPADGSARSVWLEQAGPTKKGETLKVELTLGPAYPMLVGRIFDADGQPAANQEIDISQDLYEPPLRNPASGPRHVSSSRHQTDEEGRFRVPHRGNAAHGGWFLRVVTAPGIAGAPVGWIQRYAEADFPAPSADGTRLDVGELTLRDVPLLVAGRVEDEAGAPVNQAWLRIRYPLGEEPNERWFNLSSRYQGRIGTDAEGHFEVRVLQDVRALRLSASRKGKGSSKEIEVSPGTPDVRLVLEPDEDFTKTRGRVVGSILFDEEVPILFISVVLQLDRGQMDTHPFGGGFVLEHVPPGTHRLEVRTVDTDWLLASVDDVVVRPGETTRDPRLVDIDLRNRLRLLRLRVERADGTPFAKGNVELYVDREGGKLRTDGEGRLTTLVRAADTNFLFGRRGYVPVEIVWSPDEQLVVLEEE